MPHLHGPEKLALRRRRAAARGFLQVKKNGFTHISVPSAIAAPAKTMVKAAAEHCKLDSVAGRPHHFMAHAALAARPQMGERQFQEARKLNRNAGPAKYSVSSWAMSGPRSGRWADAWSSEEKLLPREAEPPDPWFSGSDPWRAAVLSPPPRGVPSHGADADPQAEPLFRRWCGCSAIRRRVRLWQRDLTPRSDGDCGSA
mmetsp:Transcript_21280/g.66581  ORF Transcript_21280/g.66581 Transcript_21280/m.66581 type:complete len:200 (+) Transcript_21280:172-771(+)